MSSQSHSPSNFSGVFLDTSVLLNYVLQQDDGTAKELLKEHDSKNYTGKTPKREFSNIKQRRKQILKSIYKCDDLSNWEPPSSVQMSDNDRGWCADLLAKLSKISSDKEVENRLSKEERRFSRGNDVLFSNPEGLIYDVWPNNLDARLLSSISFVQVKNDRHVVCESADWSSDVDPSSLITSDSDDLLSQRDRIVEKVNRSRDLETLNILSPDEFLDEDPDY